MRPEGHYTPYRFLDLPPQGLGFGTNVLPNDVQGIITFLGATITLTTSNPNIVLSVNGAQCGGGGALGYPSGTLYAFTVNDLWVPIYGGEVVRVDFNGGAGDVFSCNVSGILYSVNVAT